MQLSTGFVIAEDRLEITFCHLYVTYLCIRVTGSQVSTGGDEYHFKIWAFSSDTEPTATDHAIDAPFYNGYMASKYTIGYQG